MLLEDDLMNGFLLSVWKQN